MEEFKLFNGKSLSRDEKLEEEFFKVIYGRRSIRKYKDMEVEKDKIIKLLKAGMAAPSACNLQIWEFIVITEKESLNRLKNSIGEGDYNAPVAMVICANLENVPWSGEDWRIELSAAVENMMLAATVLGLGSVWIGSHDEEALRNLLDIPPNIRVMNVVYFGYPDEKKLSGTKYTEDAIYWQKYDQNRKRSLRTMGMKYDASVQE